MSRADKISPLQKIPEYYSDFPINLDKNQVTGQVARLTNDEAVKQSLINLVLTNRQERPYQPYIGSRVRASLFDPIDDPFTLENIKQSIEDCIRDNEPRATSVVVELAPSLDGNAYDVQIHFSLINITAVFTANLTLERIR
jgi:phage baseplate assembly protein W